MQDDVSHKTSADLICDESRRRGITVTRFAHIQKGFALLEYRDQQQRILSSSVDGQSHVGFKLMFNKKLAMEILQRGKFPIPADGLVTTLAEAEAFLEQYGRIVVKPISNSGGNGVTPDITTTAGLAAAVERAWQVNDETDQGKRLVVQEHVDGEDYRLLVINYRHVFAARRDPARVIGDGASTVAELVARRNEQFIPEKHITFTETAEGLLAKQGLTRDSVPKSGQEVRLALVANTHAGGTIVNVTHQCGMEVARQAAAVARFLKAPVIGVDCMSPNISQTIGKIIEVNPTPDLRYPELELTAAVVRAVVDMLFPETATPDVSYS